MDRTTIALLLAYDGAPFRGWQRQPPQPTVQDAIENALREALGRRLQIHGASRTDAGVHAEGQVAHFHARLPVDLAALGTRLRAALPAGIELRALAPASRSFHARSSAIGKRYRYRFSWGGRRAEPRAFWLGADAAPRWDLAREALDALRSLPTLPGLAAQSRDFKPAPPLASWTVAEERDDAGGRATLEVSGEAFRKHQVRNLAGHLAAIALRLAEPPSLAQLASLHRPWRGAVAPPHGLTLLEVAYPADLDPFRRTTRGARVE